MMPHRSASSPEVLEEQVPPLTIAAIAADLAAMDRLLASGADPNAGDANGSTALIHAALQGHLAVVDVLLDRGADVGCTNGAGEKALMLAARAGHSDIVRRLIAAGADGAEALQWMAARGAAQAAFVLLEACPDAAAVRNADGFPPLIVAIQRCDAVCVDHLLAAGIDPTTEDDIGNLPLAHAAIAGRTDIVDRLIAAGSPLDRPSRYGETALSLAIMREHVAVAEQLIAAGADIRYAYAHVAGAGSARHQELAEQLLPAPMRPYARSRSLVAALADDDVLEALRGRDDFLIGITTGERSLTRSITMNAVPAAVGSILVENAPAHMQSLLRHLAFDGVLDRKITVLDRRDDGGLDERPMIFDTPEAVAVRDNYKVRMPLGVEVEPINWCNLRCRYCHVSFMERPPIKRIEPADLPHLEGLKNCFVQVGAAFEPTLNKGFAGIIDFFQAGGCEISVITNASLLTDQMIDSLARSDLYSVQISFDAGSKATYESIRRNSDFETATGNIARLRRRLREAGKNSFILLSVVLMRSNIDELPACIDLAEELGADLLGFQFMVTRFDDGTDALIDESLDPILPHAYRRLDEAAEYAIAGRKKILIGGSYYAHTPLRQRYPQQILNGLVVPDPSVQPKHFLNKYVHLQIGHHPQMDHNCVSPYTFARIHADGDVSVCRDFIIGNIKRARFEDIWLGPAAHFVRQFLIANPVVCAHCEHYKFCLQPATVSIDDPNHMGNNVERTSDTADRLRDRRLTNDLAAAAAASPWLSELFEAVAAGDAAAAAGLWDGREPADAVNLATTEGVTPLMFAVHHRRNDIVRLLLSMGASPNRADSFGNVPLAVALLHKAEDVVETLLAHGADRDQALVYAVEHDALDLARRALALKADPGQFSNGWALVHVALSRANTMMAKLLIDAGADIDTPSPNGSPLIRAATMGVEWLAVYLLDHGADLEARDALGSTALMRAAAQNRKNIVDLLLTRGASLALSPDAPPGDLAAQIDWRDASGATPLMRAASAGLPLLVEALTERGADIEARDAHGSTALMRAAAAGVPQTADILLNRGASLNAGDNHGSTALVHAAAQGHASLACRLIERGAEAGRPNATEQDAAQIAAREGHCDLTVQLIEAGADAVRTEVFAGAPEILARYRSAWERRAVREAGKISSWLGDFFAAVAADEEGDFISRMQDNRPEADPGLSTGDGVTPLMLAAALHREMMLRRLLDRGTAAQAQNRFADSALTMALSRSHRDLAELLLNRGGDLQHALLRGVIADHADIVAGAVAFGADVRATDMRAGDDYGQSLLFTALSRGRNAAAAQLIAAGAPLDVCDRYGRTPLIWAAAVPHAEILIPKMLARGADPTVTDNNGASAADYLKQRGRNNEAAMLI